MPNIDTSKIENFDSMTDAEKVTALLGVEIPEAVDLTGYVKKSVFDAKASEAAELSKKLKGKMTEDELTEAERQRIEAENKQKYDDLESKYNDLLKKSTVAEYKAKFIAQGYEEALAEDTARALADGDMAKVFANQAKAQEARDKKLKAELMNKTPAPGGNNGGDGGEHTAGINQAKRIGKTKAEADKTAADVMKHYI